MWSDRETEQDCLGYSSYVAVLADICTHKGLAPLTLGIFGAWGSGKTSLMKMLEARIAKAPDSESTKTLWFNAWRYEGREEAQSALIHAIIGKLGEEQGVASEAKDLVKRLVEGASVLKLAKFIGKTAITMTPDIEGFISCFKEESEKIAETMEQFDKDFAELLRVAGVDRIVVFIDDLDRCTSEKVIETFETIKLFLNTPECTFVIGADATKIEQAVGDVYKVGDERRRKDFLEKIVQIPFSIPEQNLQDVACYVGMLIIGQHLDDSAWEKLVESRPRFYGAGERTAEILAAWPKENEAFFKGDVGAVAAELAQVLPYVNSLARGLRGNPRQIKRFLNILALRRRLAAENELDIEPALLIKMGVLEYVWDGFFSVVAETLDPQTGVSELIVELSRARESGAEPSDSELVNEAAKNAGLLEYLAAEPEITGEMDLRPYLMLAQTSLSRGPEATLLPADEAARGLAKQIESTDRLRSKTAASRAAALEESLAEAVVRVLAGDLPSVADAASATNIVTGLGTIAESHGNLFARVLVAVESVAMKNDAVSLAALSVIRKAEEYGAAIPEGLRERFEEGSDVAKALDPGRSRRRKKPGT